MRRLLVFVLVIAVVTPAAAALVGAQADGGPFDRDTLVANGEHDADAPPSVRQLGEPVRGGIAIRHKPASPLQNDWSYVEPGQTIETDRIQLYSTAYGGATGDYQLVIVQWSDTTRSVDADNGTRTEQIAAGQTVQRVDVEIQEGYSTTEVNLASNYNDSKEVTMWLEQGGDRVDGATWRFEHRSVASGQAVNIDTRADAWWYAGRTAVLPGIAGIIAGLSLARGVLKQTGRGPGYSLGAWLIGGGLGIAAGLGGLYYQLAAVVAHFDILMGLSLGLVAFGGGMRMHPPLEKIGFEQQVLTDGVALRDSDADPDAVADGGETGQDFVEIPDDGYHDELYEHLPILPTVRTDDGSRRVPVTGIRPFFARLFASPAELDLDALQTRIKVASGAISEKIYVDPAEDEAVRHRPARLKRQLPVWHRLEDREDADTGTKALYGVLTLIAVGLPAIGYVAADAALNAPLIGAGVGLVGLAILGHTAVDGEIEFEPAPRHFVSANASLTVLQREHADAKTLEQYEETVWNERLRTKFEAREVESHRDETVSQRMNEKALGGDLDALQDGDDVDRAELVGGDIEEGDSE